MNERTFARRAIAGGLFVAAALSAAGASAAGLYFSDRGVRPIGRGGAFVAGADDLGALWYNPAGLAFAGKSVLVDGSWLNFGSTHQRRSLVRDPSTGQERVLGEDYFPEVSGSSPILPIPTLAISNDLGVENWNFAAGVVAPYSAIASYPENDLAFQGQVVPPPQRYGLYSLDGSALAMIGAWASYQPSKNLAFGAGLQVLTGSFNSRLAFSACPPDRLLCAQEDPAYDAVTQLKVGPIAAPSGNAGFIGILHDAPSMQVRVGGSIQLPFWVRSGAKVQIRLPTAAVFRDARVEGDEATVGFRLPAIARLGLETRLGEKRLTRLEIAAFYEAWSMHDQITISPRGEGIRLRGVTGFPDPYTVGELGTARGFRDTYSLHGGIEHTFTLEGYDLTLRGGAAYERSAVPPEWLSVLTVDLDKVQLSAGASLYLMSKKQLRLDAVIGHTFGFSVDVDPRAAQVTKTKVLRANDPADEDVTRINGGRYTARATIVGVGLNWSY
jgi:long-chain fatty acid transport protein